MIVLEYILLVGVIVCAIAAPLCKRLLASVIVYMALSLMMAVLLARTSRLLKEPKDDEALKSWLEQQLAAFWALNQ